MTKFARKCDATGKGMNEGFCVLDGHKYFSEEKHLIEFLREGNTNSDIVSDKELLEEAYKNEELTRSAYKLPIYVYRYIVTAGINAGTVPCLQDLVILKKLREMTVFFIFICSFPYYK